jgi:hypothetical protein
MGSRRVKREGLSAAERVFVALILFSACASCQTGFWKETGDNIGKGSLVSAFGTLGAIYGGPVGAFGGSMLGYFLMETVENDLKLADVQGNLWEMAGAKGAIEATTEPLLDSLWRRVISLVGWCFGGWLAFYFAKQFVWERRNDKKIAKKLNDNGFGERKP